MKERKYLSYDSRPIKVVEIIKSFRASPGLVIGGGWDRGGLDLSSGTGLFNIRVVKHIITPSRLRHHIGLGFRYHHALHAMGLSTLMSLRYICA